MAHDTLTPQQRRVFNAVAARQGGNTATHAVAAETGISLTRAHTVLNKLQSRGLIEGRGSFWRCPRDPRTVLDLEEK